MILTRYDHILLDGATEVGGVLVGILKGCLWHHQKIGIQIVGTIAAVAVLIGHQGGSGNHISHVEVIGANAFRELCK